LILPKKGYVERETALIKINTRPEDRAEALRIADIFRARIIDSTQNTYTVEITGDVNKVEAIIQLLRPLGIKSLVRTGRIAIAREELRKVSVREFSERRVVSE